MQDASRTATPSCDIELSDTVENPYVRRWRMCTIAAKNYLPSVQLLVESFRRHHPDIPVSVLVVDAQPDDVIDHLGFDAHRLGDLPIGDLATAQMATYYDVTELSTALKPYLLQHLLDDGETAVMYLDPDIEVFAPLWDLFELAERHQIVLTPHMTEPTHRGDAYLPEELIFQSGQFNLGFIAVNKAARPFLDYWSERTLMLAVNDISRGYFTDQRWVDAVPTMFTHTVVRDTGCNVAYWNLHQRTLERTLDGDYTIDGKPLRFFHYSGHDPRRPFRLSKYVVDPDRVAVDRKPALRRLLRERSDRMLGLDPDGSRRPYGLGRTGEGLRLDLTTRRVYWDAVRAAQTEGREPPPAGFGPDRGRRLREWLAAPAHPGSPITRHLAGVWQSRADLRAVYPEPEGKDAARFLDWAQCEHGFLDETPAPLRVQPDPALNLPGVNLVGYMAGEFGLGAASRMVARMVRATGLPLSTTTIYPLEHRNEHPEHLIGEGARYCFSILAINANGLQSFSLDPHYELHRNRPKVGVWYWEVDKLPRSMWSAYDLVDEVWCSTEYMRSSLARWTEGTVRKHPLIIDVPTEPPAITRTDLGLPEDRFLFGCIFDYASVLRRKNPTGVIRAYQAAFGPDDGATLIVKTINGNQWPEEMAMVRDAADDRPDIIVIDDHLSVVEMRALTARLDCFVSLHRSEGLGLSLAASMAAGVPVIATGYSGNLEFMSKSNSVLVPYKLTDVGPGADPYPADACWAEPDADVAASEMRRLFDHPDDAREIGARGRASIQAGHSASAAGAWFAERFGELTGIDVRAREPA